MCCCRLCVWALQGRPALAAGFLQPCVAAIRLAGSSVPSAVPAPRLLQNQMPSACGGGRHPRAAEAEAPWLRVTSWGSPAAVAAAEPGWFRSQAPLSQPDADGSSRCRQHQLQVRGGFCEQLGSGKSPDWEEAPRLVLPAPNYPKSPSVPREGELQLPGPSTGSCPRYPGPVTGCWVVSDHPAHPLPHRGPSAGWVWAPALPSPGFCAIGSLREAGSRWERLVGGRERVSCRLFPAAPLEGGNDPRSRRPGPARSDWADWDSWDRGRGSLTPGGNSGWQEEPPLPASARHLLSAIAEHPS